MEQGSWKLRQQKGTTTSVDRKQETGHQNGTRFGTVLKRVPFMTFMGHYCEQYCIRTFMQLIHSM